MAALTGAMDHVAARHARDYRQDENAERMQVEFGEQVQSVGSLCGSKTLMLIAISYAANGAAPPCAGLTFATLPSLPLRNKVRSKVLAVACPRYDRRPFRRS